MTHLIRLARPDEADLLTDIAIRSKAYWGYDEAFMAACRAELTITPDEIEAITLYVIEVHGHVAGFYTLEQMHGSAEMTALFVAPEAIGHGCGRQLWEHAVAKARRDGDRWLYIESDPNAQPFYEHMGAVQVGEVPSESIDGRKLPLMRYKLVEDND